MAFLPVDQQLSILMRGVIDLVSADDLQQKLALSRQTGRPLRVKLGIDPTGSDLTLGHTVPLRKLKQFQDLGHQAVLIIGDYTAMVGDPSGRNDARPALTHEQTRANARTFVDQAAKILDVDRLEIRYNGEWLAPMTFGDVVKLTAKMTVARMLERDDFGKRYAEGRPISIHEFLYPLMQGSDSVAIESDVELGGSDQKFNLLVGRDLQRDAGQPPQICLMTPIVEGLDGVQKMSKSLGNYIGLNESAEEMYGKTMSIPDALIIKYFIHFTEVTMPDIQGMASAIATGANPMAFKQRLGREIAALYHGVDAAERAEAYFRTVVQNRALPEEMASLPVRAADLGPGGRVVLHRLLVLTGLAPSSSEARRLAAQGGVTVDGERHDDPVAEVAVRSGMVLRAGKRRFGVVELSE